jgi:hypothetical protein
MLKRHSDFSELNLKLDGKGAPGGSIGNGNGGAPLAGS